MKHTSLTILQLKRLLVDVLDHAHGTCVRVRSMGEMWQTHFMRVVSVTEERFLLIDEVGNRLLSFPFNNIMQMEIDYRFRQFEPHNHYDVVPDSRSTTPVFHSLTNDPAQPDERH